MALKLILDTLEGLSEDLHDNYEKKEDGKWHLAVPGMVDKKQINEFRDNNRQLKTQLDDLTEKMKLFSDVDLDEVKTLKEQQRKIAEKELIDKGEIDTIVEQRMKPVLAAKDNEITALKTQYGTAETQLARLMIDNRTAELATQYGVEAGALSDLTARARGQFQIKDGKVVSLDEEGQTVYSGDGMTPLSLDKSWIETVKTTAPHLFRPASGTGAESGNNRRAGAPDPSKMSSMQKIAAGFTEKEAR